MLRAFADSWASALLPFLNWVSSLGLSKGLCAGFLSYPGVIFGNLSPFKLT